MQSFDLKKFVEILTLNVHIKIHKTVFYIFNNSELKSSVPIRFITEQMNT